MINRFEHETEEKTSYKIELNKLQ